MYIHKKEVTIFQKLSTDSFIERNNTIIGAPSIAISANDNAQTKILVNSKFCAAILPEIVGLGADDREFKKIVSKVLYEMTILIPASTGKKLDISFVYDINASEFKTEISKLSVKTSEELATYVEKNVEEINKALYGKPVNYEDYFTYVFCYYHSRVANSFDLIDKSTKIMFYMISQIDVENNKKKAYNTNKSIRKYLLQLDEKGEDSTLFNNVCTVLGIKGNSYIDKYTNLELFSVSNPTEFLEAVTDSKSNDKALIMNYISMGLLYKIPSSGVIVDMQDRAKVIGNNYNDAIAFINNSANKMYVDTLASSYLQMKNSK